MKGNLMGGSMRLGDTLRVGVIDYAVDTLDLALASFRRKKAEVLEVCTETARTSD